MIGISNTATFHMSIDSITLWLLDGDEFYSYNSFIASDECVWEWDIIGLWSRGTDMSLWWSVVVLSIIIGCIVVVLIAFVILLIFIQKHRSNKRQQLDSKLLNPAAEPEV